MPVDLSSLYQIPFQCSEELKKWRDHSSSLTEMLETVTGSAQLHLIKQQWIMPCWWDEWVLKFGRQAVFQREILMQHAGVNYWYARSIIPESCYALEPAFFQRLKHESIKNLIFKSSRVQCTQRAVYAIDKQCLEYYWINNYVNDTDVILWVRFAEYTFKQKQPFYLIEILLPPLEQLTCRR